MIVIKLLPRGKTQPLCDRPLELLNHSRNRRGEHCSSFLRRADSQQQMDMVGHDHIVVYADRAVVLRDGSDGFIRCLSVFRERNVLWTSNALPYGLLPEPIASFPCAEGEKVRPRGA